MLGFFNGLIFAIISKNFAVRKKLRILIVLLLVVGSLFISESNQYVQFYPVVWKYGYDELLIDDVHLPEDFYTHLEKVLRYYKEDYKVENGIIYVKRSLYIDMDLCWNYTSKATNKEWLHSKEKTIFE